MTTVPFTHDATRAYLAQRGIDTEHVNIERSTRYLEYLTALAIQRQWSHAGYQCSDGPEGRTLDIAGDVGDPTPIVERIKSRLGWLVDDYGQIVRVLEEKCCGT
jgi:hypothetical protein